MKISGATCPASDASAPASGFGSDAQAGAETLELGFSKDAAPMQFRQVAERLGGVRAGRLGRWRCGGDGRANRLLDPAPALPVGEPGVDGVGASRDGRGANHLTQQDHRGGP